MNYCLICILAIWQKWQDSEPEHQRSDTEHEQPVIVSEMIEVPLYSDMFCFRDNNDNDL